MKTVILCLVFLSGVAVAGETTFREPVTRQAVATVSTTTWRNGDTTSVVRDPATREPVVVVQKTVFGAVLRDPVTREIRATGN